VLQWAMQDNSIGGVLRESSKGWASEPRPNGLHNNPNAAALYLLMGMSSALAQIGWNRTKNLRDPTNLFFLGCAGLMTWGIILGQGRSGLIGAMLIFLFKFFDHWRVPRLTTVTTVVVGSGVALVLQKLVNTYLAKLYSGRDVSGFGREERWAEAAEILIAHPFFGDPSIRASGIGRVASLNYHNDAINLAVEIGIPGAMFFLLMQGQAAFVSWDDSYRKRGAGFTAMALYTVMSATVHSFFHVVLASGICYWLIVGLMCTRRPLQMGRSQRKLSRYPAIPPRRAAPPRRPKLRQVPPPPRAPARRSG